MPQSRLITLDWCRGMVIVLMALDHARLLTSTLGGEDDGEGGLHETWYHIPHTSFGLFILRFVTYVAAPGFFFLMGCSLYLKSKSTGSAAKMMKYATVRSLLLIFIGAFLSIRELNLLSAESHQIYLSVMWALGGSLWLGMFWLMTLDECKKQFKKIRTGVPSMRVWGINSQVDLETDTDMSRNSKLTVALITATFALVVAVGMQAIVPKDTPENLKQHDDGEFSFISVIFWLSSRSIIGQGWQVFSRYPILPWLSFTMRGISYAMIVDSPVMTSKPNRKVPLNISLSIFYLISFIGIRFTDGFGNSNARLHLDGSVLDNLQSVLTVVKYPPSLAYICINLFILHVCMAIFEWLDRDVVDNAVASNDNLITNVEYLLESDTDPTETLRNTPRIVTEVEPLIGGVRVKLSQKQIAQKVLYPLQVFGSSPLFFYIMHFLLFIAIGKLIKLIFNEGVGYGGLCVVWLVGLVCLFWMCKWYGALKMSKSKDSVWRFF